MGKLEKSIFIANANKSQLSQIVKMAMGRCDNYIQLASDLGAHSLAKEFIGTFNYLELKLGQIDDFDEEDERDEFGNNSKAFVYFKNNIRSSIKLMEQLASTELL